MQGLLIPWLCWAYELFSRNSWFFAFRWKLNYVIIIMKRWKFCATGRWICLTTNAMGLGAVTNCNRVGERESLFVTATSQSTDRYMVYFIEIKCRSFSAFQRINVKSIFCTVCEKPIFTVVDLVLLHLTVHAFIFIKRTWNLASPHSPN